MLGKLFLAFLFHSLVLTAASSASSSEEDDSSRETDHDEEHPKSSHGHWKYDDQDAWSSDFQHCSGHSQSPINIETKEAIFDSRLPKIKLEGYDLSDAESLRLVNNGHTLQLSLPNTMRIVSGFDTTFLAAQLHFHWGTKEVPGSEHTIDNVHFPAEIHVVHYNSKYANISEAASKSDGLAVLGAFIGLAALEDTLKAEQNQHLTKNFRAPQLLHGRQVLSSFRAEPSSSGPQTTFHPDSNDPSKKGRSMNEPANSEQLFSRGDILATAFGVLFTVTLLSFMMYACQQRKKSSRLKKDARQNVIYKPATKEEV
ncbi:hypothetical protein AGOR_G00013380 [Albula goreensis]|uniref:Carbonic anhydrase n=1 Tax=Albula goreensis TaxID=1534307 RepID=A0A8T3E8A8_9TELE|nr:hypothetical protein AGOR_G00013380 [Albula goreensis]